MFTASTIFVCPGACIATVLFHKSNTNCLDDFPTVKCPVKPSSTAVVSIDNTASVPPLPSRITCPLLMPHLLLSPWHRLVHPSMLQFVYQTVWSTSASVHTARATSLLRYRRTMPVCNVQCPAPSKPRSLAIAFLRECLTNGACSSADEGKSPASSIAFQNQRLFLRPLASISTVKVQQTGLWIAAFLGISCLILTVCGMLKCFRDNFRNCAKRRLRPSLATKRCCPSPEFQVCLWSFPQSRLTLCGPLLSILQHVLLG